MTADPPITVVYSEDKGVKVITDNNGGTIAQPYVADIRYYPSLDFAKSLAMNSANCKQFIKFGCKNAKLLNAGEKDRLANWISAGGVYQDYWGGAPPNLESCACGVNNTCLPDKKKKCNCDARSNNWTKDEGFLTATADLPVTQVVFRDVNPLKGSAANFTVGNLYCSGEHCDYYICVDGVRLRVVPLSHNPSWPCKILGLRRYRKEGLRSKPESLSYALLSLRKNMIVLMLVALTYTLSTFEM